MSIPDQEQAGLSHTLHVLLHSVIDEVALLALAVLVGLVAARAMRRLALHWSWAACAVVLAVLARPFGGGTAAPLVLAALTATLRERHAHLRDLHSGGDLAGAARRRSTPLATLRGLARRAGSATLERARRAGEQALAAPGRSAALAAPGRSAARLALGTGTDGRQVSVPWREGSVGHALVVGATGSGKTVTQTLLAVRAIQAGLAAVVIDPKGDSGMSERLREAALRCSRPFYEWTPSGPLVYNPYGRGEETEIADRVLAGERFTEPHYMRQAQRYMGHVVRTLRACGRAVSLAAIVELLEPAMLEQLLHSLPEQSAAGGHGYLDSLSARQLRDLAGVRDRLAILTESDVGAWLDPCTGGRHLDLLAAIRSRAVVYFRLESDRRPLLSRMLGAAIIADLQSVVATLQASPAPTLLVIDEFSAVAAEQVVALFGRARSAGFSLLLGTQELSDLRLPGRERMLEQVVGNLSLLIAHRQVVPDSAELLARLGGSRGCWRVTWSSDGRASRTRSQEPVIDAHTLTTLTPGWSAVIPLGDPRGARLARITPAEDGAR